MAFGTLKDVRKSFGSTEVLHGVDVAVEDGEFLRAGRALGLRQVDLLRMIAGLEEISAGHLQSVRKWSTMWNPRSATSPWCSRTNALLSAHERVRHMAFSLKLAGDPGRTPRVRVEEAALILGLQEYLKRYPRQLSGGQRQRVAMGRRDRPASRRYSVRRAAVQSRRQGCAWPCAPRSGASTAPEDHVGLRHPRPDRGIPMADKIVVMNGGRVEQTGSPLDLYDNPANQFVAGFIGIGRR